jgi:sortase B
MNVIRKIAFVLVLAVFCVSAFHLYEYWDEGQENSSVIEALTDQAVEASDPSDPVPILVDFKELWKVNSDIIAWIYCPDSPIHYPIVQASDNDYYLHRMPDGNSNKAGSIFMDCRNRSDFSDWNSIVYGHNMKNNTMFGTLDRYKEQAYYESHPVWYLLTPDQNYKLELIAGYVTDTDSDIYQSIQTKEERDALLDSLKAASVFSSDVKVEEKEKLVTLSTCSYEYENARFVITGVLKSLIK